MFHFEAESVWTVIVRTSVVYVAMLVLLRVSGKRQIGQFTPFDLVVLLLISNSVQNAMTGPETSVSGGLTSAITLVAINRAVSYVTAKFPGARRAVEGDPVVLVRHGVVDEFNLAHEGFSHDELCAILREHEVTDPSQVALATLEIDGTISVVRVDPNVQEKVHHTRRRLARHGRKSGP